MSAQSVNELLARGCSEHWQTRAEARNECSSEEFGAICDELLALRKQAALDRQSREASQAEFARLNRELNEERSRVGALLDEIASAAIAAGMMDPEQRGSLDGPNAIQFLRQMKEEYEARRD